VGCAMLVLGMQCMLLVFKLGGRLVCVFFKRIEIEVFP